LKLTYAIAFVSDMERSVAFYRDLIGLPLEFESGEWTQFATGGAVFALHRGEVKGEPNPNIKQPGLCRPGFSVTDLDAFHRRLREAGVHCIQEPRDVYGTRIAQYADPDGLVVSFSERRGSA